MIPALEIQIHLSAYLQIYAEIPILQMIERATMSSRAEVVIAPGASKKKIKPR